MSSSKHELERHSICWEELTPKKHSNGSEELWAPKQSGFDFNFNCLNTDRKESVANEQKAFHGTVKNAPSKPPSSTSKPHISIKLRHESRSRVLKGLLGVPMIGKRKDRDDDSEAEEVDDDDGEMRLQAKEKGVTGELYILARDFVDPLLDMTMDSPHKVTRKMLVLRMCIEKALKKDVLTTEEEDMLREAVVKAKESSDAVKYEDDGLSEDGDGKSV